MSFKVILILAYSNAVKAVSYAITASYGTTAAGTTLTKTMPYKGSDFFEYSTGLKAWAISTDGTGAKLSVYTNDGQVLAQLVYPANRVNSNIMLMYDSLKLYPLNGATAIFQHKLMLNMGVYTLA